MEVSSSFWIGFIILVIALLSLDMFLFNRKGTVIDVKRALWLSLFWISLAFIFNVGVYMVFGKESALEFFTAYLVEESLSIDNLFVFIIIFSAFKIKPEHQHTVLFWGILGAIVFRAIFIFAGVALIERFAWIMYLFGVFLLFTGGKMMFDELNLLDREKVDEPKDPNSNGVVKIFRRLFPVHEDMSEPVFLENRQKTVCYPLLSGLAGDRVYRPDFCHRFHSRGTFGFTNTHSSSTPPISLPFWGYVRSISRCGASWICSIT